MKKVKKLSRFWRIAIPTAVVVLLLAGGAYAWHRHNSKPKPAPTTIDGQPVNLQPATASDKAQNDANKNAIVQHDQQVKDNTGKPPTVSVVITGADRSAGHAYVSGVFEDGGTCTATATMGGQTASATSTGFKNVSYTQCAPLTWNTPLTPGNWSVTVNYKSASGQGSQTQTIEVK